MARYFTRLCTPEPRYIRAPNRLPKPFPDAMTCLTRDPACNVSSYTGSPIFHGGEYRFLTSNRPYRHMFSDLQGDGRKRTFVSMTLSVAMHIAVLAIALYRPAPVFVRPTSVRAGQHGTSLTPVYFSRAGVDSVSEGKVIRDQRKAALQYLSKKHAKHDFVGKDQTSLVAAGKANQARSAGSPKRLPMGWIHNGVRGQARLADRRPSAQSLYAETATRL